MFEQLTKVLGLDTARLVISLPVRRLLALDVRGPVTSGVGKPIGVARAVHADMALEGAAAIPARFSVDREVVRVLSSARFDPAKILPVAVGRAIQDAFA